MSGRVGRMGRERGQLEEERIVGRGAAVNEGCAASCEHVGQVSMPAVPEMTNRPVDVERVVVFRVAVAGHVPLVPAGRNVRVGHAAARGALEVAVEVLAHHRCAVARLLQGDVEALLLLASSVEDGHTAVGPDVGEHPGVVGKGPGEDRGARRAAQRVRDEVVAKAHALALEGLDVGHEAQQVKREVVGEDEHDVRMRARWGWSQSGGRVGGGGCPCRRSHGHRTVGSVNGPATNGQQRAQHGQPQHTALPARGQSARSGRGPGPVP